MTKLAPLSIILALAAVSACGSPGQSDRGPVAPIAPSCDDIAKDATDLYARAGRVNGHKAELLANLRVACPTWPASARACVSQALQHGDVIQLEDCGVVEVDLILPDEH